MTYADSGVCADGVPGVRNVAEERMEQPCVLPPALREARHDSSRRIIGAG
ncbi:MAG: hypothetical protein IJK84_05060 [Bacteroidales bacterium]|nr:hypothetical protein [Bacteroidales bacterium]